MTSMHETLKTVLYPMLFSGAVYVVASFGSSTSPVSGTGAPMNQQSMEAPGKINLQTERSMRMLCMESADSCLLGAWNRTVRVFSERGHGTGFILRSDEKWMTVLTASHVLDAETSADSVERLVSASVEDPDTGDKFRVVQACANRIKAFDSVLLLVPNFTAYKFPNVELGDAIPGESTVVVEFAHQERTAHDLPIISYFDYDKSFSMSGKLWPGASGSAVLSVTGDLIGVFVAIFKFRDRSEGSFEVDHFVKMRWPELREFSNEPSSPIICSN